VNRVGRDPEIPDPLIFRLNFLHDLIRLGDAFLHSLYLCFLQRFAEFLHL